MDKKELIRKKYFSIRKKKYFRIKDKFFIPLIGILKKYKTTKKNISLYYPSSYEVDTLKILSLKFFKKFQFSLPVVEENNTMNFYKWKINDVLNLNKFGIPEPFKSEIIIPNVILVPLLAYDKNKNRLGYGKGFYDRYLNKFIKENKKILTVGIAFSFQKYNNLPVNNKDFRLNYIISEKGII
tara:strand:- start:3479 stop:4027 length:549 start_codon:yes stop_codon:yes gene_type:complete